MTSERGLRRERWRAQFVEDVRSRALVPTVVGGALVILAEVVSWFGNGRILDAVTLSIGGLGLLLVLVGVTIAWRFAYRSERANGTSAPRSVGRSLKRAVGFLLRWSP